MAAALQHLVLIIEPSQLICRAYNESLAQTIAIQPVEQFPPETRSALAVVVLRLSGQGITMQRGDLEGVISGSLATEQGGSQSNSVRRALAILEFLKESERHRNLSEISRKLSLPKSTTSVLLSTLASLGYVTRDATERRYSLTTKSF